MPKPNALVALALTEYYFTNFHLFPVPVISTVRRKYYANAYQYSFLFIRVFAILTGLTCLNIVILSMYLNLSKIKSDEPKDTWFLPIDSM